MDNKIVLADDEKPKKSLVERINESLESTRREGQEEITLQDIAIRLEIDSATLNRWITFDNEFKKELEKYNELDKAILYDEELGNRADVMLIALLLLEMKKKHEK
jgi:hypothetical protein